jgi:hypothetical protein
MKRITIALFLAGFLFACGGKKKTDTKPEAAGSGSGEETKKEPEPEPVAPSGGGW